MTGGTEALPLDERKLDPAIALAALDETAPREPHRLFALKHGDCFAVADAYGDIRGVGDGFFRDDTRVLSEFRLTVGGRSTSLLGASLSQDNVLFTANLTNLPIRSAGGRDIPQGGIHIERVRLIWEDRLFERITLSNYSQAHSTLLLSLQFGADFRDMFEVRGSTRLKRGTARAAETDGNSVVLRYEGLDKLVRSSVISFSQAPDRLAAGRADFLIAVTKRSSKVFYVEVGAEPTDRPDRERFRAAAARARFAMRAKRRHGATLHSSGRVFNDWLARARADVALLTTELATGPYPYAGIPWFSTAFGRDGVISALQMLWLNPGLARGVLSFLAHHQATEAAIELRQPHVEVHGCLEGSAHQPHHMVANAVARHPGRAQGGVVRPDRAVVVGHRIEEDGVVGQRAQAPAGMERGRKQLVGHLPRPFRRRQAHIQEMAGVRGPHLARLAITVQRQRIGVELVDPEGAFDRLAHFLGPRLQPVGGLFVSAPPGEPAEAFQRGKDITLNFHQRDRSFRDTAVGVEDGIEAVLPALVGEARFGGALVGEETGALARLLRPLRGRAQRGPQPVDKSHVAGAVGIGAGQIDVERRGVDAAIVAAEGQFAQRRHFALARLVHDLAGLCVAEGRGFTRAPGEAPIAYPVACLPQAWSAGAAFMLMQACLGLEIDGWKGEIRVNRPRLPIGIDSLTVRHLQVGEVGVDLTFERVGDRVAAFLADRHEGLAPLIVTT